MNNYDEYLNNIRKNLTAFGKSSKGLPGQNERIDLGNQLLIQISGQLLELMRYMTQTRNPLKPIAQVQRVPMAGTGKQLPDIRIPPGHEVVIKALGTNNDEVFVAASKSEVEDETRRFPLSANEAVSYEIDNLNEIWVNAVVSDEGIVWTVEHEKEARDG